MSVRTFIHKLLLVAITASTAVGLFFAMAWLLGRKSGLEERHRYDVADASSVVRSIFAADFPKNEQFKSELSLLRGTNRLDPTNEQLIDTLIRNSSAELDMPSGILWCLLFQESRFNHLTGLDEDRRAKGIGQFAYFSFHEINHNLDRFTDENLQMFIKVLGWDMRPIAPLKDRLNAPASYYYIPTAVTTSAAFLNNRYHQLRRVLDRKKIRYSPDVLWLYSAMAYNKGTRSVLSFWNKSLARGGKKEVERLLVEPGRLFESLNRQERFTQSLAHIWPIQTAEKYAEELTRHMKQIKECSVDPEIAKSMEPRKGGAPK